MTKYLAPHIFITAFEFNILTKISFDARIKEAMKSTASKSQVDIALDIVGKNSEKILKSFKHLS